MTETQIIAALARECWLPWAMCRSTWYDGDIVHRCAGARGHANHSNSATRWPNDDDPLPDTLETWAAKWAAERPGEPGPVRDWTSEDGRVRWATTDGCFVSITVGELQAVRWMHVPGWAVGQDDDCTSADVADLARLMQAADKAGA